MINKLQTYFWKFAKKTKHKTIFVNVDNFDNLPKLHTFVTYN